MTMETTPTTATIRVPQSISTSSNRQQQCTKHALQHSQLQQTLPSPPTADQQHQAPNTSMQACTQRARTRTCTTQSPTAHSYSFTRNHNRCCRHRRWASRRRSRSRHCSRCIRCHCVVRVQAHTLYRLSHRRCMCIVLCFHCKQKVPNASAQPPSLAHVHLHAHPHTHAHPPTNAYTKTYTCADAGGGGGAGAGAGVGYLSFGRCCGFVAARVSGRSSNS